MIFKNKMKAKLFVCNFTVRVFSIHSNYALFFSINCCGHLQLKTKNKMQLNALNNENNKKSDIDTKKTKLTAVLISNTIKFLVSFALFSAIQVYAQKEKLFSVNAILIFYSSKIGVLLNEIVQNPAFGDFLKKELFTKKGVFNKLYKKTPPKFGSKWLVVFVFAFAFSVLSFVPKNIETISSQYHQSHYVLESNENKNEKWINLEK